jgi:hypothetical protein
MSLLCKFSTVKLPDGRYKHECMRVTCTLGPDITDKERPAFRNCNGVPDATRVFNFTLAAISHLAQGCPTCTQEEIDARLVVCKKCELYKKINESVGYCTHKSCGCSITDIRGYVNKLAWKDQHCPILKWPNDLTPYGQRT